MIHNDFHEMVLAYPRVQLYYFKDYLPPSIARWPHSYLNMTYAVTIPLYADVGQPASNYFRWGITIILAKSMAMEKRHNDAKPIVTDFGRRSVCDQNYSKVIALPKQALINCGMDIRKVNVELVQAGTEKYLKLTPVTAEVE